jgi:hypothetical protein
VGAEECVFKNIQLRNGFGRLEATLQESGTVFGVKYVEVNKVD